MTEIIEHIRKKLPPDEGEVLKDLETVDKEILEYLKEFRARKSSRSNS